MKRSGLIAGLIIIALTAGSVFAFGKSYARDIYTYDCEILEQRPEQLTKFCADAGDRRRRACGFVRRRTIRIPAAGVAGQ